MMSIVVPTFRREGLLGPLFQAVAAEVAAQTVPVELVLVDNSPEASARVVAGMAPDFVRYVHEPRTGVAQARNRGVAEAKGSHVIFLDDDEMPVPGWLAAFVGAAARGDQAAFGAVEAAYAEPPPPALRAALDRVFSRRIPAASGQDVSHLRAYLGSGNSLFRRDVLALEAPPFDPAFDTGGEDVALFRKLVDRHGITLIWCPEARVAEIVPQGRATLAFLQRRRFSDGQLRCLVESQKRGLRGSLRVALWMAVGAAQVGLHGLAALALWPVSAERAVQHRLAAVGGAGKLLWWRRKSGH
jgi:cellulose synthase/poly-beta-1,6-N-acetylglucosamine synthase-like glycosyltransferase